MADTALVNMSASSGLAATDLLYTIVDPSGTPLDRKLTGTQLKTFTSASPSLVTPVLGVATATSINGLTITSTTSGVLTIPNSVTLTGPAASGTAMTLGNAETVTGVKTFTAAAPQIIMGVNTTTLGSIKMFGNTSGDVTISPAAVAGTATAITFPATTTILAGLSVASQVIAGGATVTSLTQAAGNLTFNPGLRPLQFQTNSGAFTLTAPAADGSGILLSTNDGSAGTITFSGFSVGSNTGDTLTTTNTQKFSIHIWRINGVSGYRVAAHQ